jgi:hypothetical protein
MLHVQQNVPKQGRRYALVPLLQTPATGYRSEADSSCCTSCAVDSKQRPCWAVHLGRSARRVQESHRPGYAVLKQLTDRMCVCVCVMHKFLDVLVRQWKTRWQLRALEPPASSTVVLQFPLSADPRQRAGVVISTDASAGGESEAYWTDGRAFQGCLSVPAGRYASIAAETQAQRTTQHKERLSGFVSAYYPLRVDLSDYDCFRLYCRDESERGRLWLFGVATDSPIRERSIFYRPFRLEPGPSSTSCTAVDMPFSEFAMTYRGLVVDSAEGMNTRRIQGFLVTLMDTNPGRFSLVMDRLEAFRRSAFETSCGTE